MSGKAALHVSVPRRRTVSRLDDCDCEKRRTVVVGLRWGRDGRAQRAAGVLARGRRADGVREIDGSMHYGPVCVLERGEAAD